MMVIVCATVTMMGHIGSFGNNNCWYGQTRGMVIFIPLTDPFDGYDDKRPNHQNEYDGEHDAKDIEHAKALIETHSKSKAHFFSPCAFTKGASHHREAP